jgi:hypothetical protein
MTHHKQRLINRRSVADIVVIVSVLLAGILFLSGCVTPPVGSDVAKWKIELASAEEPPSGPCRIYDAAGRLMLSGSLDAGAMDSEWHGTTSDGTRVLTVTYRKDVRQGPVRMWYGPFEFPESRTHLKLEGLFENNQYHGEVIRYRQGTGARHSVRIYNKGVLQSAKAWKADGSEASASEAKTLANLEHERDIRYFAEFEQMVRRALREARREITAQK